jgi:RNA polymerase sigma-70 factor (ECF subfamily)
MSPSPDPKAVPDFDQLYAEHGQRIYRFCFHMAGNRQDAEDLTQETFLALMAGWRRFRNESKLSTWLYQIAHRKARRLRRARTLAELFRPETRSTTPSDSRLDFERAIAGLSPINREAFLLVKVEGLTVPETAAILGAPEGTVKFRVFQAVKRLRARLYDAYQPPQKQVTHEL